MTVNPQGRLYSGSQDLGELLHLRKCSKIFLTMIASTKLYSKHFTYLIHLSLTITSEINSIIISSYSLGS
jgi:hypothetical protein